MASLPTVATSNLVALGEFLRNRRALLSPKQAGIVPAPRRKAAGLRREEVAAIAGISTDWYTRIELGKAGVPSSSTLEAVCKALQLGIADQRYLFELGGLPLPRDRRPAVKPLTPSFPYIVSHLRDAAVMVLDRYVTPHAWNATADGIFRWSQHSDAFDRNVVVAGLCDPYYRVLVGDDYDKVARGVIGSFRRAFTTSDPTPFAKRVFDFAMSYEFFRSIWNETSVSESYTGPEPFVRHVPEIGPLWVDFVDLIQPTDTSLLIRVLTPHDAATKARFARLASIGIARALEA